MLNLVVRKVNPGTKSVNYRFYFSADNVDIFLDAIKN